MHPPSTKSERTTLLIVDDSRDDRENCRRLLSSFMEGETIIEEAGSGAEALQRIKERRPTCVLLDYRLGDMTGLEFVDQVTAADGGVGFPIVMMTGHAGDQLAGKALGAGVADFLDKGSMTRSALVRSVTNAVEKHDLRQSLHLNAVRLARTVKELTRRNAEIQSFYHTLSHELRTPLSAAQEFIALVLEGLGGPLTDDQRDYLSIAHRNCLRMNGHINDMMSVSRLQTGKVALNRIPGQLERLACDLVASFGPAARQKQIQLSFEAEPELPPALFDELRLEQVINNLLTNALKFTAAGGSVSVRVSRGTADAGAIEVAVSDTGCGISADKREAVFDRLYQVSQGDEGFVGGLGLGLNICRELVDMHGGQIWLESSVGVGSTFHFSIPVCVAMPLVAQGDPVS